MRSVAAMSDGAEDLIAAIDGLERVSADLTPSEAAMSIDAATLQTFWMEWPRVSGWAGALWRQLNQDLDEPAAAPSDHDLDETGGSG